MTRKLCWLAGAWLVLSAVSAAAAPHPFADGRPFPTIALPSMTDGSPSSIADFRGKKLVLHVFASW